MTVSTMLIGLVPLLWASGSGADVMKRIAAPMVGGLLTSAFLTLELIPVVYTYWRQEQLLWELLPAHDPRRLRWLKTLASVHGMAWASLGAVPVAMVYIELPSAWRVVTVALAATSIVASAFAYLSLRPAARRLVWP
jgi:Cu(I)/Ag(I) efflux system membrane protein CusA/SilA